MFFTSDGSKLIARSKSSTISLFNIFLTHPPTNLSSILSYDINKLNNFLISLCLESLKTLFHILI